MPGYILLILQILGLLLILLGLIGTALFIFDIRKLSLSGKNVVQVKAPWFEVNVSTGNVYFAIALGLIMVIGPYPLYDYIGQVRQVRAAMSRTQPLWDTPAPERRAFTLSEQEVWVNLQKRKQIRPLEYTRGELSRVEWYVRRVIKKVDPNIPVLHFRHATSGVGIMPLDKPGNYLWRQLSEESNAAVYNPFLDLIAGRKPLSDLFHDLLIRNGQMKTFYMTVPITVGEGQIIEYRLLYHNAFQHPESEWAGMVFDADTDVGFLNVSFPEDKPYKRFRHYRRRTGGGRRIPFKPAEGDVRTYENRTIRWQIRNGKQGELYLIQWDW